MILSGGPLVETPLFLLRCTGLPWLIREVFCRKRVAIVLYHNPDPEMLERHLRHFAKHYNIITTDQLVDAIHKHSWSDIPPKSLIIHLDDGCRENHRLTGLFRQFEVTPTLYVCSHIVGTHRRFWMSLDRRYSLDLRRAEYRSLLRILEHRTDFTVDREFPERVALSRKEIQEMSDSVDFQSHGRYHFSLSTMDDETAREDIMSSKNSLEELLDKPCLHFSYAYGDHSDRDADCVRQCGYRSGRTTLPGWNTVRTDPYRLKIIADIPDIVSMNAFQAHMSGIPRHVKRCLYKLITGHIYRVKQERLLKHYLQSNQSSNNRNGGR